MTLDGTTMRRTLRRYWLPTVLLGSGLLLAWLGLRPAAPHAARIRSDSAATSLATPPNVTVKATMPAATRSAAQPHEPASISESETAANTVAAPGDPDRIRALAREDPAGALLALANTPPGENREAMLEIVCAEVAQFDPAQAVALASRFSGGNPLLLENLVHQWAAHDDIAAESHATALPAGELRNRLVSRVALARAKTRPAEAATLALAQIEPGDLQRETLIAIVHEWASQDVAQAAAWVGRFPAGPLRDRAAAEIRIARGR